MPNSFSYIKLITDKRNPTSTKRAFIKINNLEYVNQITIGSTSVLELKLEHLKQPILALDYNSSNTSYSLSYDIWHNLQGWMFLPQTSIPTWTNLEFICEKIYLISEYDSNTVDIKLEDGRDLSSTSSVYAGPFPTSYNSLNGQFGWDTYLTYIAAQATSMSICSDLYGNATIEMSQTSPGPEFSWIAGY